MKNVLLTVFFIFGFLSTLDSAQAQFVPFSAWNHVVESQTAYVKSSNTVFDVPWSGSAGFGYSLSVDVDTMVVGATGEDSNATGIGGVETNNLASGSGAVYVFTRTAGVWSQQAYIKASNTAASDAFGDSVSLSGDTLAVGATGEDSNATGIGGVETNNLASGSGAVYVFTRTAGVWSQQAYIKASNTAASDAFGTSVSLSGDTLAVGANSEDSNATGIGGVETNNLASGSGAVYVFTRTAGVWSQQAFVKASATGSGDTFGDSVSLYGETLAVGASGEDSNSTGVNGDQANNLATGAGAVYVFTRTAGVWSQQAYIKASNTAAGDFFGDSVSLYGDTLAVRASGENSNATGVEGDQTNNSASASGAVYVFTRTAGVWSQQAYIKASNTGPGDLFGGSISLFGDTLAVGASAEDSNSTGVDGVQADNSAGSSGAVYVFTRAAGVWSQQNYIKASNTGTSDSFGVSVGLSGDTLAVGAWNEDSNATGINGLQSDNSASGAGATYVFTRSAGVWSQQAFVKASTVVFPVPFYNISQFGYSVSMSGDSLAVGAYGEYSNATGINGTQTDNSENGAGAVYVFTRSNGEWSQQAYIKASNTDASHSFGISVNLSGDTLAVGANAETSNATGINGDQTYRSYTGAGAVYVFTRAGVVWSQQAYIKASNTGFNDRFGTSVSLSGDTLAVGAAYEDSLASGVGGLQTDNSATDAGAVYVFTRTAGAWSQQAYIKASNTGAGDLFGIQLSLSRDTLAVGARREDSLASGVGGLQTDNSATDAGAVYVFTRTAGAWSQQAYIKASNTGAGDLFGTSLSLSGETLAVGASDESSSATGVGGLQSDNSASMSGAVYVFTRVSGVWSQQAYIKASNTGTGDVFGTSLSLSGDTLAIGAHYESSNATGVGGLQSDNSAINSGAVYVFTRAAGAWSQRSYIKASNTGTGDYFGSSLSLSGDNLAVGAYGEDSHATGIGGDQANNSASSAGAIYIYRLF